MLSLSNIKPINRLDSWDVAFVNVGRILLQEKVLKKYWILVHKKELNTPCYTVYSLF